MDLEMKLLPVVVGMESVGVGVDRSLLQSIRESALTNTKARQAEVRMLLGEPALNLNSPQQLLAALKKVGLNLPNTSEAVLKAAEDDTGVVASLLNHRTSEKLGQQPASLLKAAGADGRIRCSFNPTGTDTGRFSCTAPNLQNIGRGSIRSAFVPEPGNKLIVADYAQIELRIAAVVASDQKMLAAYRAGADLHRETAAAVLEKPMEEVTKQDRQLAKAVNFGLLYGQGAPGLVRYAAGSYGVNIQEEDAARIRALFFARYKGLSRWHAKAWEKARAKATEIRTRLGRRRLIPPEASEWERFTTLVNTEVQGGAADGMKLALVELAHRLPTGASIISTVHDEVIVEAPAGLADQIRELTQTVMIDSMAGLYPEVPIEVEAHVCRHWGEK
jgi:DNA polymerase-1